MASHDNLAVEFNDSGFEALQKLLTEYQQKADTSGALGIVEEGAKAMVKDLLTLPRPRSAINAAGYTHMVDCFAYRREDREVSVGWGKYYGFMVEHGTRKMRTQPHLEPLWNRNKEKYYRIMVNRFQI